MAKMNIHFSVCACHPGYGADHLYHDSDQSIEISVAKLSLPANGACLVCRCTYAVRGEDTFSSRTPVVYFELISAQVCV